MLSTTVSSSSSLIVEYSSANLFSAKAESDRKLRGVVPYLVTVQAQFLLILFPLSLNKTTSVVVTLCSVVEPFYSFSLYSDVSSLIYPS